MATGSAARKTKYATFADVLERIGHIPADRVLLVPTPGTVTEQDWVDRHVTAERLCELVGGTLVEKAMGWREAWLAFHLGTLLRPFVDANQLGIVVGDGGPYRLKLGLIRLPDLAFASWDRIPEDYDFNSPDRPYVEAIPDLAIEVLSESNTAKEMAIERQEYFKAGVRLVWEVEPERKEVDVYTSPKRKVTFGMGDELSGGSVLPGLTPPVAAVFDYPSHPTRPKKGKK
jgi:Uma2 family endonuclease